MATSVNKVILVGRLGRDPEMKFTQGGVSYAKFSIATDETWKDQGGERQQRTEWHNIVAWRKLADICGQWLTKGKLVYIEGHLQTRSWEDKEGNKKYMTEVQTDNMLMLSGGGGDYKADYKKKDDSSKTKNGSNLEAVSEEMPF
tara:strand:+ start:406 stop:837 length:432 start_codon:yes stop_codon:yes gene_type:complete